MSGLALSSNWPMLALLGGAWMLLVDAPRLSRSRLAYDALVVRVTGWTFLTAGAVTWFLVNRG
ncbi:hypothetical protein U7230_08295 [Carboxydochorda subterranea]|uniref:Uncharacterized protein n=1 Tax=Carboxydichorda subterranea TaxID=3109565 RepID=A0ABZ1BTG1_9FIRM|nr:hypothetical protein [Limnochorda sp. L945t]WRP16107.1 hypothetical protein U7230_08295 [Limnochorda sp. L945t]